MQVTASPKRAVARPAVKPRVSQLPQTKSVRLYATPVLLSAFLLFLVQPMLAKAILPRFGGVASVWIVAMLFFQGMLVVGYGYTYLIARFLPSRVQPILHVLLLLGSLLLMPIAPWRTWQAETPGDPSLQILRVLFLSVGLPYFLLSTTGPLIQAWYSRSQRIAFPYRLFALSNLGSLVALLAYPTAVEPFISTRHQMLVWSSLYGVFTVVCTVAAFHFWRSRAEACEASTAPVTSSPGWREYLRWGALAACGSALLVTVMNHLCQNVAPMPLLWVLPLATYLLTFILSFDRQGWYRPAFLRWLLPPALGFMMFGIFDPNSLPSAKIQIPLYLGCLFIACLFCHGELARRKPHANYLTGFYLMLSLGGAIASIAIGLVAPRISTWQIEFPQTLVACAILALPALYPRHWARQAIGAALIAVLLLMAMGTIRPRKEGIVLQARSFFGALTVAQEDLMRDPRFPPGHFTMRVLRHGWIRHGTQFLDPKLSLVPTAYYSAKSGVGMLLHLMPEPKNVAIIGLGSGALAPYAKPTDSFTYYEIDPLMARVANNQFSYLKSAKAPVRVVLGDGRLSLEKEPAQKFNLVVIDAFSGDSIPTHLLTREAFELYFSKLKADGVVAVHITNGYLDLSPVLSAVTDAMHKQAVSVSNGLYETLGAYPSEWVLIASDPAAFSALPQAKLQTLPPLPPGFEVWTDDYSNVLQLLK
jgi:hypothetical protein